jgi:hypothetical protein
MTLLDSYERVVLIFLTCDSARHDKVPCLYRGMVEFRKLS